MENVTFKRWRGQHLLNDRNMLRKIVHAADLQPTDTVIEVGAGTGNLTVLLAQRAARVIAIEIDNDLVPALKKRLCYPEPLGGTRDKLREGAREVPQHRDSLPTAGRLTPFEMTDKTWMTCGNVKIMHTDARTFEPRTANLAPLSYLVVANIPYNITSLLIRKFLEADVPPSKMILLIQKEVALRICAQPPAMSLLSVAVQYYANPRILFSVPRTCFTPRPHVDSTVVEIISRHSEGGYPFSSPGYALREVASKGHPPSSDFTSAFFHLVTAGFSHKRKYLISNISGELAIPRDRLALLFEKLKLPLTARAQELSLDQWQALRRSIDSKNA